MSVKLEGLRGLVQAVHHEAMHPGLPPPHVEAKSPLWTRSENLVSEDELIASQSDSGKSGPKE